VVLIDDQPPAPVVEEFGMKRLLGAVGTALVAASTLLVVGVATAATASAGECGGGTYLEITSHSVVYHPVYGPFTDDNGTSAPAKSSYQSKVEKTVKSTKDASLSASLGDVIASVKASISTSVTSSQTTSITHTVTYTIEPHKTLHVEYAIRQIRVHMHHYSENLACHEYNSTWGYANIDNGVGWHTWVTAYGS
jgi:hypothetical protein